MNYKRTLGDGSQEASTSPRKMRQISNSPIGSPECSRKFKQPMTYTPVSKPSPSKADMWKIELGLSDSENNNSFITDDEDEGSLGSHRDLLELNVLRREMEKKERQKDELLSNLKTLTDKLNVFRTKLQKAEEVSRSKLKITKKTFETKVKEKEKLIQNLQGFIDEQEIRMRQILEEKGGEDAEVVFNFSNSIHPLVSQVSALQNDKVKLTEKNLSIEYQLNESKNKVNELKQQMENEYVSLDEFKLLQLEKEYLQKNKGLHDKENNMYRPALNEEESKAKIEKLQNELKDLRDHVHVKDEKYFSEITSMESENLSLKKKLKSVEIKYTTLSFTPPKVHVRTVVDEDTEKALDTVTAEKRNLQSLLRTKHRTYEEQVETSRKENLLLSEKLEKQKENNEKLQKRVTDLEEQIENSRVLQKLLDEEIGRNKPLQVKLDEKKDEIETIVNESKRREIVLKKQMENKIRDAIAATEKKYEHFRKLKQTLSNLSGHLRELREFKAKISEEVDQFKSAATAGMADIKIQLLHAVSDTNEKSQILAQRYKREIQLRKKLHNELVEIKGNIRVLCRVRPIIKEDGDQCSNVISFDRDDDGVLLVNCKSTQRRFEMDKVFSSSATQSEVFKDVKSLVTSCLDGYNVCIFAYGQTGSGKTYTMEGSESSPGINQKALQLLFKESSESLDWDFTILVSFMEIYNEMLRDLLSVEPEAKLDIKQNKDGTMYVPKLTHVKVSGVSDVNQVFGLGHRNRKTACTDMNERSSRSHSVLIVTVIGCNNNTNTKITGKLNLVDLAGSERISKSGSEGIRMKEAQSINKSLSALGDVIHSLKNKNQHIPYRNTKLTYLLQDSLGGDSKTLMVVQVAPVDKNAAETVCSLNFAQRVRTVELGQASRKVHKS